MESSQESRPPESRKARRIKPSRRGTRPESRARPLRVVHLTAHSSLEVVLTPDGDHRVNLWWNPEDGSRPKMATIEVHDTLEGADRVVQAFSHLITQIREDEPARVPTPEDSPTSEDSPR